MTIEILTAARLRELLHYNPQTGVFTWRVRTSKYSYKKGGDVAGGLAPSGYIRIGIKGRNYQALNARRSKST